jgi:two-component system chemotaxis response regulator CheB
VSRPIRVLVVDDSALMRGVLARLLPADGDIAVAGVAADAGEARALIRSLTPDVVTLDIEMPTLNGLKFLERLMRLKPLPVVMVSSLTQRGAGETLLALELGAVDFVAKPKAADAGGLSAWGGALREKVRAAAGSAVRSRLAAVPSPPIVSAAGPERAVIALAASTGGVEAIRVVLAGLPADCPPVAIVQHMPAGFTARFAARLDAVSALTVREAQEGAPLRAGHAYLAPGDRHLSVVRGRRGYVCRLSGGDAVSGHRPSADVLFGSVAETAGPLGIGVILTGMGRDGAAGLIRMRDAGAHTLGQSAASALVYGMPRAAFEIGAVAEQAALEAMPGRIAAALSRMRTAA